MPETLTLETVRQRVLARRETLSDEVVSVKSLLMDPSQPGRMIVRRPGSSVETSYPMDELVYTQASSVIVGIPGAYLKKLIEGDKGDPGLAAMNFNHWVGQSADREVLLLFRDSGGSKILRAIKSASWFPIPFEDSVNTLITKLGPDRQVQLTTLNHTMLVLDVVTRALQPKIDRSVHNIGQHDDPFEWGFRFQDSDAGRCDLTVSPYVRRLICLNGATTTTRGLIISIAHTGRDAGIAQQIQSSIRQGVEMLDGYSNKIVEQIEASKKIELDLDDEGSPKVAINKVQKDMLVTKLEAKYIQEAWVKEGDTIPDPNLYRLYNSITRAGTHAEEISEDRRLYLQGVGGRVMELATTRFNWN